jgi:hemoglobin-like flavoprotein
VSREVARVTHRVRVSRMAAAANRRTARGFAASRAPPALATLASMSLDVTLLETSFDLVAPRGGELVETFYANLFAAAPAVEPLFAEADLTQQKAKLLGTLVLLRKSLRNLDAIVPKLRDMGARHVAYGARPEHYPVVGNVLIAAMADIAGDGWRPEYTDAWTTAYGVVAGAMLAGAAASEAERAA